MAQYEIINTTSGQSLGIFSANTVGDASDRAWSTLNSHLCNDSIEGVEYDIEKERWYCPETL